MWSSLKTYTIALALVLLSIPVLQEVLYDRSLEIIRAMKPYQTPVLTDLMNLFSFLGDGEVFFLCNLVMFMLGLVDAFKYLSITFGMALHWVTWLKMQLCHSRPQFDDPSIGIVNASSFCSGEFGNPSGHSLLTSFYLFTLLFYFQPFKKNACANRLLWAVAYLYVACVCFCRLYLGRHSLDQITLGLTIGTISAYFCVDCFQKYLYEPIFYPKANENPKISAQRSRNAFLVSSAIFVALSFKMTGLYLWVDANNVIPPQWLDSVISSCPKFKKSHLFHHFSMANTGFVAVIPFTYMWNYFKHAAWSEHGRPKDVATGSIPSWCLMTGARAFMLLLGEHVITDRLPILICGTKDLEPFHDFAKNFVLVLYITWLTEPFSEWLKHSKLAQV